MDKQRKGYEWWDRLCNLPKFSFIIKADGVRRVEDSTGNWLEYASAQAVIDDAQAEINILRERLDRLAPAAARAPSPGVDAVVQKACAPGDVVHAAAIHTLGDRHQFGEMATFIGGWRYAEVHHGFTGPAAPSPAGSAIEREPTKHRTLQEQIRDAKAEVAAWEPDRREAVVLQGPRDDHPPSRDCMCATCRPAFDNGANDPVQRYDARGGGNE